MEQSRKRLKILSMAILIFAGATILKRLSMILFGGLNDATVSVGLSGGILLVAKMVLLAVSLVVLLPHVYVGVKGLKMAENPDLAKKGHVFWATVLLVLNLVGLLSSVQSIVGRVFIVENVLEILGGLVEAAIFYGYIKYAKAVSEEG